MYHMDKDGNLCSPSGAAIQCMHQQVDCGTACAAFELRSEIIPNEYFTAVLHCCKRGITLAPAPAKKAAN